MTNRPDVAPNRISCNTQTVGSRNVVWIIPFREDNVHFAQYLFVCCIV